MQRQTASAAVRTHGRSMRSHTEDGELEDNRGGSGGRYRDDRSERRRSDRRDDRGWHDWGGHHREREDDSRRDRDRGREAERPSGGGGAGDSLKCTVCGKSFSGPKVLETHCRVLHKGAGMSAAGGTVAAAAGPASNSAEAAGWQTLQDPSSGAYYYYNATTQQSSWVWPPESANAPPAQSQLQDLGKLLGEQAAVWTA